MPGLERAAVASGWGAGGRAAETGTEEKMGGAGSGQPSAARHRCGAAGNAESIRATDLRIMMVNIEPAAMRFRKLTRLACLVALMGACAAQVQVSKVQGWLRADIERDNEKVKRPILTYLDAARLVADAITNEFCSGRDDGLIADLEASAKAVGKQQGDMQKSIATFHKMIGPVTSFEYRNQALEFQAGQTDLRDVAHATSAVFYSVITGQVGDATGGLHFDGGRENQTNYLLDGFN